MDIKSRLSVYCITYNRIEYLKRTLDSFIESPISSVDFTILDNASTDGSSELIDRYSEKYKNIKHVRHEFNIGGNANICRAIELGASSDTDYFWCICDDDIFDFSNWTEVEDNIKKGTDLICVCDYAFPDKIKDKSNLAYQLFQMTFLPSIIIKKSILPYDVFFNIYDCVVMLFPHLCIPIYAANHNKNIHVLSKPIVLPGHEFNKVKADASYFRGIDSSWVLDRKKYTFWILGFSNVLTLLSDKKLASEMVEIGVLYKDIFGSWEHFFYCSFNTYYLTNKMHLFKEVYGFLPQRIKFRWHMYFVKRKLKFYMLFIQELLEFIFSVHSIVHEKQRRVCVVFFGFSFLV